MDTLIFGGLLFTLFAIYAQRSRRVVLAAWWVVLVACLVLLRHHITSGLGLGLTW
ncbi:DUF5993 family protein [Nocardia goodfellowii]|uniref:Uncharacterized protein n=1 Tax=Nocardia goodfellowii TaxID=882446 RepID=A0ABS4Q7E0_9NOCA|nr:DUF5993 family protein [Nocardia goodfellowii]MBP2187594.1 hypothetical protein [Nocardia goodfellowii]